MCWNLRISLCILFACFVFIKANSTTMHKSTSVESVEGKEKSSVLKSVDKIVGTLLKSEKFYILTEMIAEKAASKLLHKFNSGYGRKSNNEVTRNKKINFRDDKISETESLPLQNQTLLHYQHTRNLSDHAYNNRVSESQIIDDKMKNKEQLTESQQILVNEKVSKFPFKVHNSDILKNYGDLKKTNLSMNYKQIKSYKPTSITNKDYITNTEYHTITKKQASITNEYSITTQDLLIPISKFPDTKNMVWQRGDELHTYSKSPDYEGFHDQLVKILKAGKNIKL